MIGSINLSDIQESVRSNASASGDIRASGILERIYEQTGCGFPQDIQVMKTKNIIPRNC